MIFLLAICLDFSTGASSPSRSRELFESGLVRGCLLWLCSFHLFPSTLLPRWFEAIQVSVLVFLLLFSSMSAIPTPVQHEAVPTLTTHHLLFSSTRSYPTSHSNPPFPFPFFESTLIPIPFSLLPHNMRPFPSSFPPPTPLYSLHQLEALQLFFLVLPLPLLLRVSLLPPPLLLSPPQHEAIPIVALTTTTLLLDQLEAI